MRAAGHRILFSATALLVFAGCASVSVDTPASVEEYQGGIQKGTASIYGEAFSKTRGGEVKFATGCVIHLDPYTSYSRELYEKLRKHGIFEERNEQKTVKQIDPLMLQYRRNTRENSVGQFKFSSVAAGDYFVSCYIGWTWYDGQVNRETGRWHVARVKLAEGEQKKIILY
jgi:hypothetical protein